MWAFLPTYKGRGILPTLDEKLRKICELQKDEEEELEELIKVKDESVIYRAIILYTRDLGVD